MGHAHLQTSMSYFSSVKEHLQSPLVEDTDVADLEEKLDRVMGMPQEEVSDATEDKAEKATG